MAQLHKSSGEVVKKRPRCLVRNSNAVVELETSRPICMELYRDVKELGRFMLRVGGITIAAGLVTQVSNVFYHHHNLNERLGSLMVKMPVFHAGGPRLKSQSNQYLTFSLPNPSITSDKA